MSTPHTGEHKSHHTTVSELKAVNKVHHVTSILDYHTRRDAAAKAGQIVCVDFFAEWCGPCKRIAPEFDVLAKEEANVVFLKVDVDSLDEISEEAGIKSMPTFKFYYGYEEVAQCTGADMKKIKAALDKAYVEKVKRTQ